MFDKMTATHLRLSDPTRNPFELLSVHFAFLTQLLPRLSTMTIEEHSEQSYTEIGNYDTANDAEDHSLVDTRTGDFTETYREELLRTPDADKDAKQMEKLIRRQARRVQRGRRMFLAFTLIVGILVATGAFLSLSKLQQVDSTERVSLDANLCSLGRNRIFLTPLWLHCAVSYSIIGCPTGNNSYFGKFEKSCGRLERRHNSRSPQTE
jgi:hypothetical protein